MFKNIILKRKKKPSTTENRNSEVLGFEEG